MPGEATGIEAVVAGAVDQAKALLASERAAELRQIDLLALPDAEALVAEARGELGADAPATAVRELARRRGRPAGSRNRRTDDFKKWILSFGPHPAITLMRIQGMPVEELAAQLGCKKVEALDRQIRCAETLQPYLEGKMPVAIDLGVQGDFTLAIMGLNATAAEIEQARELTFTDAEIVEAEFEETQGLSGSEGGASE